MQRIGDWIQTFTGKQFFPFDPRPEDICIEDISHALSLLCRFGGHCREFYSVAQHSVLVSLNCPRWPLHGLLHDASESYIVDLPSPIKRHLVDIGVMEYAEAEMNISGVIMWKFGVLRTIDMPSEKWERSEETKAADLLLLATEARDLVSPLHPEWAVKLAGKPTLETPIIAVGPVEAERIFLDRFNQLYPQ
jgi:hypothetical protein